MALYGKRWRNTRPEESYQHTLKLQREAWNRRSALTVRICKTPGCGNLREPGHQFCEECAMAARSWRWNKYGNTHREIIAERRRKAAANRGEWRTPEQKKKRHEYELRRQAARRRKQEKVAAKAKAVEGQVQIDGTAHGS